jgi:hypothetical protein
MKIANAREHGTVPFFSTDKTQHVCRVRDHQTMLDILDINMRNQQFLVLEINHDC